MNLYSSQLHCSAGIMCLPSDIASSEEEVEVASDTIEIDLTATSAGNASGEMHNPVIPVVVSTFVILFYFQ